MNKRSETTILSPALFERFASIVGKRYVVSDPADLQPYVEMRNLYRGRSSMVLRPGTTGEVADIVKLAGEMGLPIVPQGGNTGMVGGQIPFKGEIVVSLSRLDRIREVDPVCNTITAEAGVTLQRVREAAAEVGRLYPQLLPSEGTCTIGGNLSTNAGGVAAVAHGVARSHALGLEVVMADGRILRDLNKLKKNNTGYDLRNIFIGSEGTLGIITAAVLKILPRPRSMATAFVGVADPASALALLKIAEGRSSNGVTSFELISHACIDAVLKHVPSARDPLGSAHAWYVLFEMSSDMESGLHDVMEGILAAGVGQGCVEDATIAASLEQSRQFWFIRESVAEVQSRMGGSIKHDVSVPIAAVPQFISEANAAMNKLIPGSIPMPFGHAGDGNIHYNISQPPGADKNGFLECREEVNEVVYEIVTRFGGAISAEHGIGVQKRDKLPLYKDPVALDLMRTLKRALDPNNILNPGKVLDE